MNTSSETQTAKPGRTVREQIRAHYGTLTQSERKFANALLANYPAAGLASITIVAANADVSTPTVARMVQKLGYKGYPQFHQALLQELEATVSGPTQRRANWASEVPETHLLNRFVTAIGHNIEQTLSNIDTAQFDEAVQALADSERRLYLVGGRITRALAEYAFTHFQAVRQRITHMTSSSATWPHYLLDMEAGDVLLMFDVRRYEKNLLRLAELAAERGVRVILITDQWASPVAAVADQTFHCWVEIPSAWDSNISTMMLLETLIAAVQEENWPETRARYERLDEIFDAARLFGK
ncbi:MurR/RpiR family transcriptional regulator [Roseovarius pelagicus]|uniref:MurR/RpiR family transcriptional regulator n=1 Tax=Roseovarius pelagicus TaxID=2980108 RepID=A0ABY6DG82_9RHOB|nr:MurR/RpiR family transcriptional regulator [Roseovarius pelagicus]UXX85156.1 MurR/RpiR family transcriptional regulator [Roseovarius pelagicus]